MQTLRAARRARKGGPERRTIHERAAHTGTRSEQFPERRVTGETSAHWASLPSRPRNGCFLRRQGVGL